MNHQSFELAPLIAGPLQTVDNVLDPSDIEVFAMVELQHFEGGEHVRNRRRVDVIARLTEVYGGGDRVDAEMAQLREVFEWNRISAIGLRDDDQFRQFREAGGFRLLILKCPEGTP